MVRQLVHRRTVGMAVAILATLVGFLAGPGTAPVRPVCPSIDELSNRTADAAARLLVGEGPPEERAMLYQELNRYDNPIAVFGLNMRPVLWNDAAVAYQGEYPDTVELIRDGQVVGYLGQVPEADRPRQGNSGSAVPAAFLLGACFLVLLLLGETLPLLMLAMGSLLLMVRFEPAPCLLFFQTVPLLMAARHTRRPSWAAPLLLSGFMVLFLTLVFAAPVNGLSLYHAFQYPLFTISLLLAMLAAAVLMVHEPHPVVWVPLVAVLPVCPASALAALVLLAGARLWRRATPSANVASVLAVSVGLLVILYGTTWMRLHRLAEAAPTSMTQLEQQAFAALDHYLEAAGADGYRDLRDFLQRSGLAEDRFDFEAVYFNTVGEIVDTYASGLPEIMELPAERSVERISSGHRERQVVAGVAPFKYGILSLRLSADLDNLSFLKPDSPYRDAFQVDTAPDGDRFRLVVRMPSLFKLLSDLSLLALICLVLLAAFLRLTEHGRTGLMGRVMFSQFSVLIGVFVVTGLVIALQSRSVLQAFSRDDLVRTTETIARMVERDEDQLSDNTMKFLSDIAQAGTGLYLDGIVLFASDHLNMPVLLPYPVYRHLLEDDEGGITVAGDVAYTPVRLDRFPGAMLRLQPAADWTGARVIRAARLLAMALLLVFLASFAITGALVRRMVRPILQLADASRSVAAGSFEVDVRYDRDDEIRSLVEAMTAMAQAIRDQQLNLRTLLTNVSSAVALVDSAGTVVAANPVFDRLPDDVRANALARVNPGKWDLVMHDRHYQLALLFMENGQRVVIVDDVTEVVRVSRLSVITDMARQISHDIKNPLTPIRLNAEYLLSVAERDPGQLPQAVTKAADNILKKTEELGALAAQFSDLVRATRNREPRMAPIELGPLLTELAAGYPTMTVSMTGPDVTVMGDRLKLVRAFGNLLENSHSFTDGSGTVTIQVSVADDRVELEYRDNGRGIPPQNIGRVFEPYFSTRESGTGLGLFIVREFIMEMGGTIEAMPDPDGACFRITLRRADDADTG